LEAREKWSRADIEAFQLERLNRVWQHATAHVPYYRKLQAMTRLPPRFASVADFQTVLPILPKESVRARGRDFLSERASPGSWDFSSGSTCTPTKFFWAHEAHHEMLWSKYRHLQQWGVDIFDRMAYLWGFSSSFQAGWAGLLARVRTPVMDRLRNRLRIPAYNLGHDDLQGYLRRLQAFRPVSLYCYTSAAFVLAQEALATGARLPTLKLVILSAEPVYPHVVTTVEKAFGVPAVVEYGSVESVMIAAEGPDRMVRVREDNLIVETLPRDDGRFDILLTVLTNPSFPLLRYAIGDSTDTPMYTPLHGFAVLGGLVGRKNDLILSRGGRHLHPLWFDETFSRSPAVRAWRIHQNADGSLAVLVEPNGPDVAHELAALERRVRDKVEGLPVTIETVAQMPRTPAGKHRWIQSELVQ
jgi:phenylacetate-CoA ligase